MQVLLETTWERVPAGQHQSLQASCKGSRGSQNRRSGCYQLHLQEAIIWEKLDFRTKINCKMAAPQSPDECICKILNSYFPRTQHSSLGGRGSPSPPKIAWLSLCFILERSWVALYSDVCQSVRHRCHPTKSPLFTIYTGIQALCWPCTT